MKLLGIQKILVKLEDGDLISKVDGTKEDIARCYVNRSGTIYLVDHLSVVFKPEGFDGPIVLSRTSDFLSNSPDLMKLNWMYYREFRERFGDDPYNLEGKINDEAQTSV